jgi:hypothetical protein
MMPLVLASLGKTSVSLVGNAHNMTPNWRPFSLLLNEALPSRQTARSRKKYY